MQNDRTSITISVACDAYSEIAGTGHCVVVAFEFQLVENFEKDIQRVFLVNYSYSESYTDNSKSPQQDSCLL